MAEQTAPTATAWLSLRLTTGLSQREVERRMGWPTHGRLSLIERGIAPTPAEVRDLRRFYLGETA